VRLQVLARNPADAVDPPRPRPVEMAALDVADTARLLGAAAGSRLYLPVLLAVATGLRRGELLALRWKDLDLGGGALAVCQAMELTRAGIAFKEPKTRRSRRRVTLPALVVDVLRAHRREQVVERLGAGPAYRDLDLVLPGPGGEPWNPRYFGKSFASLVERSGVPRVRFHDLRHTHASQLLLEGVHPKVVSERLGHASVAITLDRYSHVLPGLQEDAAARIDRALRAGLGMAS